MNTKKFIENIEKISQQKLYFSENIDDNLCVSCEELKNLYKNIDDKSEISILAKYIKGINLQPIKYLYTAMNNISQIKKYIEYCMCLNRDDFIRKIEEITGLKFHYTSKTNHIRNIEQIELLKLYNIINDSTKKISIGVLADVIDGVKHEYCDCMNNRYISNINVVLEFIECLMNTNVSTPPKSIENINNEDVSIEEIFTNLFKLASNNLNLKINLILLKNKIDANSKKPIRKIYEKDAEPGKLNIDSKLFVRKTPCIISNVCYKLDDSERISDKIKKDFGIAEEGRHILVPKHENTGKPMHSFNYNKYNDTEQRIEDKTIKEYNIKEDKMIKDFGIKEDKKEEVIVIQEKKD